MLYLKQAKLSCLTHSSACNLIGIIYWERYEKLKDNKDLLMAQKYFDKAIEINSCHKESLLMRGAIHFHEAKLDDAILDFQKVVEYYPEHVSAHYNIASCKVGLGKFDEAIRYFEKAINFNMKRAEVAQFSIGYCYFIKKEMEHAKAYFNVALNNGYLEAEMYIKKIEEMEKYAGN